MSYTAVVSTRDLPLVIRTSPSKSSGKAGSIPKGAQITIDEIVEQTGGWKWGKVTYNGISGYCCIIEPNVGTWVTIKSENPPQPTPKPPEPEPPKEDDNVSEDFSEGLDSALSELMKTSINNGKPLKASMRLFGLPFQFTKMVDNRVENVSSILGRKYIENIVLEAPIVTIIPGKPVYLPAAKNKRGTVQALMSAANGSFSELAALGKTLNPDQLRYFDFQQDYIEYMKYVNILCRVSAGFLGLGDTKLDGVPLASYNWMDYRYTSDSYVSTASNVMRATSDAAKGAVETLKTYGAEAIKAATLGAVDFTGKKEETKESKILFDSGSDDKGLLESLDSLLTNMNYIQFYVDPSSSNSESASNSTATSKLEGIMEQGSDLLKELSFVVNAGGGNMSSFTDFTSESLTALTDQITKSSNGGISGFFSRILNAGSNIIKGENMIIPEIYQRSDYSKSYNIITNLHSPYGDVYSFYINILVPMLHLLALVIPKQSSPNTYAAPFLIKAFCSGSYVCNLGIVESFSIEKYGGGDARSVDGFPLDVKVTLTIKDLYSELMMSPSNDPLLFMSNSSLIDFLAINCGLDMTKPQVSTKVDYLMSIIKSSFTDIPENVMGEWNKAIDNMVSGWVKLS